jgi:hypothetical protein
MMQIRNSGQIYNLTSALFGNSDDARAILGRVNSDTWCGFAPRTVYAKALTVAQVGQDWQITSIVWQTANNSPFPAVAFTPSLSFALVPPVEKT